MNVCIIYILMGGGLFMTPGCVVDQGVVYPDEIVYTDKVPRTYSYAPLYRPTYRPKVTYHHYWPRQYRHYNRWLPDRPTYVMNPKRYRHRTIHYRKARKVKTYKVIPKNHKKKKNKFKKKK